LIINNHVTITINCVDHKIGAKIYPWIFWKNKRIKGEKAAKILIEQQQKGLEMLVAKGILVKVKIEKRKVIHQAIEVEMNRKRAAKFEVKAECVF